MAETGREKPTAVNSPTPSVQLPAVLLFGILVVAGCASVVQQSYKNFPAGPGLSLRPYSGATQVFGSVNQDNDGALIAQDGYFRIGISSFRTDGHVTFEEIRAQARAVGADIVLFSRKSPGNRRVAQPIAQDDDGTAHALAPYVHVGSSITLFSGNYGGAYSVGGGASDFKGTVTSSGIPGISSADTAAINAPEFDYIAPFWRRIRPSLPHERHPEGP